MKKVLEELFATVQDFRETVPGIDSQVNFADLNSSAVSAKKMVVNIITAAVYREIVSGGETDALSYQEVLEKLGLEDMLKDDEKA